MRNSLAQAEGHAQEKVYAVVLPLSLVGNGFEYRENEAVWAAVLSLRWAESP